MDDSNLQNVRALCTTQEQYAKVEKIRSIDPVAPNADVDDPWFGGPDGFEAVYQVLERITARWVEVLTAEQT
jgi:protein-tyrosine phosphatase